MHDRVTGWQAVERVDVGVVRFRSPSLVTAGRWVSPSGKEATIVSSRSLWRGAEPLPTTVSCPTVAKDAHVLPGRYIVDPQLQWSERDGRQVLVVPALGLCVSVPAPDDGFAKVLDRFRRRPCRARIASVSSPADPRTATSRGADAWDTASVHGSHPAVVTRWPVPVTAVPDVVVTPRTRPARLATGPAALLRDGEVDRDDYSDRQPANSGAL